MDKQARDVKCHQPIPALESHEAMSDQPALLSLSDCNAELITAQCYRLHIMGWIIIVKWRCRICHNISYLALGSILSMWLSKAVVVTSLTQLWLTRSRYFLLF